MQKKLSINTSIIEFDINDLIIIKKIVIDNPNDFEKLIKVILIYAYLYQKDIINETNIDLSKFHFQQNKLSYKSYDIKRIIKIGSFEEGAFNDISDIEGIQTSSYTLNEDPYHTGVTIIKPHSENVFKEKVVAASYIFNGFGKSCGLVQIDELGTIETPIVLTSTLKVGFMANMLVQKMLDENPDICSSTGSVNSVVLECNDATLSKARDLKIGSDEFDLAYKSLKEGKIFQGSIGAGAGMICHGLKGGLGSASRIIRIKDKEYHLAILVNTNFGSSNAEDLIVKGRKIASFKEEQLDEKGSIVGVIATDAPLNERQLKRVLKRIEIGVGRTGSFAGNGSGDVYIGFTTANKRSHYPKSVTEPIEYLSDDYLNPFFKACVDISEEAVLNSMFYSLGLKGYKKEVKSIWDYFDCFSDLIDPIIIFK